MIKNAKSSVNLVTTENGLVRKSSEFSRVLKKAKENGVKVRIAAPISKNGKKMLAELSKYAEIRNSDIDARFMVVDGEDLAFMVMDDKKVHPSYDVGIWVTTPFFASAVENLFDLAWKGMKKA